MGGFVAEAVDYKSGGGLNDMAKSVVSKKQSAEAMAENKNCADELRRAKSDNSTLKKELSTAKQTVESDARLLAQGLRLALANEALRVEVGLLRKDCSEG